MDDNNEENCNSTFTKDQKNYILIAVGGTSLLSFILCVVTISLVFCLKLYKYFTYRLAMCQVISSMIFSAVLILVLSLLDYDGDEMYYKVMCNTTAFLIEYSVWMKLLFTMCLNFHLFCLAVCLRNFQNLEVAYILFSTLFPLLFSWIPFIHNSYGVAGAWCWIRDWKDNCAAQNYLEGIIEQFVLWYGPLFVSLTVSVLAVFVIVIVLIWRAYVHKISIENEPLLERQGHYKNKKALKQLLPLLAYPVVFYLLALFPISDRIYQAISPHASFELALAHAFNISLWGFFSSLVLLIHIIVTRQLNKRKGVQFSHWHPVSSMEDTEARTVIYSSYIDCSTNTLRRYSIPTESEIDTPSQ